jgi:hypothetical protein
MKTYIHFWSYVAHFFSEWETLQTEVEKINTHILYLVNLYRKPFHLWENKEKFWAAGDVTDDKMMHGHLTLDTLGYKHAYSMYWLLLFHCNNVCTNAPQCYVIRTVHYLSCYTYLYPSSVILSDNYRVNSSRNNQHNALCWLFLLRLIMHGTNVKLQRCLVVWACKAFTSFILVSP